MPRCPRSFVVLLVGLSMLVTACSSTNVEPPAEEGPDTEASSLPLLPTGFTLVTTLYGSAELPMEGTPERALIDGAVADGLGGDTYSVDWADLEPERGTYTLTEFASRLDALQQLGVYPFVNITVVDIDSDNLPSGLSDGRGGRADGVSLDDPAVIDRFGTLLDRVVPMVAAHGGFVLGVGNEVDARFDGDDSSEREAYVTFVRAAQKRVHKVNPRLAVGVTLTSSAVRERTNTFRAFRPVSDVLPFNYAPIPEDFFVRDTSKIRRQVRSVLDAYGKGPSLIQELTCPSAASMGASEEWQRACFDRLFAELDASPQVRFASVFTFQDFDEATGAAVRDALFGDELEELPAEVAERLVHYLCQFGVVDPKGRPKPAWTVLLDAAASGSR